MKQRYLFLLILLSVIVLLTGCSRNVLVYKQALKLYNQGNFEDAFYSAAQSIVLKSSYVKAQNLISEAYQRAIQERENDIALLKASPEADKFDYMVQDYQALYDLQDRAQHLPYLTNPKTGQRITFPIKDYTFDWNHARNNAAEYHYQNGLELTESSEDVDTQKQAAKEFKQSLTFVENYKDALTLYNQSRQRGMKRLVIMPFADKSGSHGRYGALSDMLVDGIISDLVNDPEAMEFLDIVPRAQMHHAFAEMHLGDNGMIEENDAIEVSNRLGANELLTGRITQIIYTPEQVKRFMDTQTATVKIGEESYIDSDGKENKRDVMGEVSCNYIRFIKTCNATITGSYRITDLGTGKLKLQDTFTCENPWSETWARKGHGDPRALSDDIRRLCDKPEPQTPSDTELVSGALGELTQLFVRQIKSYVQ